MSEGAIRHRTPHPENRAKCGGCRLQDELARLRVALAAQVPAQEERLDVERLARASVRVADFWVPDAKGGDWISAVEFVKRLAAEYRALGAEPSKETDHA